MPAAPPPLRVAAVVVTYAYPRARLDELLAMLRGRVARLIVVDNNPDPVLHGGEAGMTAIVNRANIGLAAALNRGIDAALAGRGGRADAGREPVDAILLLDQDSRPADGMLNRLGAALDALAAAGQRPAAVGAAIYDPRLRRALPFVRFGWLGPYPVEAAPGRPVAVDMLITSGSLLSVDALQRIGVMDASLFIDAIDIDWSLRARAAGYTLYGCADARLQHLLGEHIRPLPLLGRRCFVHGPRRQYYIMRNHVRLFWRRYVPLRWKLSQLPRLLLRLAVFSLYIPPRRLNRTMLLRGLYDGLRDRDGPLSPETDS